MKYTPTQYAKVLQDITSESTPSERRSVIRDFLDSVTKNGALGLLPDVIREFEYLSDAKDKIHRVTISTPERLATEGVAKKLPFKGKIRALRDVRLMGGAVVEVDDLRIDNSVRARLGRARKAFTK